MTVRALLALLLLTASTACSAATGDSPDDGSDEAAVAGADGPLRVTQSDLGTAVVFGATGARRWSATAGSFEMCSTSPGTVLSGARFVRTTQLLGSHMVVRRFDRPAAGGGRVDPVLAGFGVPPVVGDPDPDSRHRLPGSFEQVGESQTPVPVCDADEESHVAELMVSATVTSRGGRARDVALRYSVGPTPYEWTMPLTMVLCGSEITDRDC